MVFRKNFVFFLVLSAAAAILSSCERRYGWGVLLWTVEDPFIVSGTVLPVYVRSNINRIWIAGVPQEARAAGGPARIDIPFGHLEMTGARRRAAAARAENFASYALVYAENLLAGLPIRDAPNNGAPTVYRMRRGEIIKVLDRAQGSIPIGAAGEPLAGEWLRVLAIDGTAGYSFSNRLRVFKQGEGAAGHAFFDSALLDPVLDAVMSSAWLPENSAQMIAAGSGDGTWGFDPGRDSRVARIYLPGLDLRFPYARILPQGENSWVFDGAGLSMSLLANGSLAVQFPGDAGETRTVQFASGAAAPLFFADQTDMAS